MKLSASTQEFNALITITKSKLGAGKLIKALTTDHFSTEVNQNLFTLLANAYSNGKPYSFTKLIASPGIPLPIRAKFNTFNQKYTKLSPEGVNSLIETLDQYRKIRLLASITDRASNALTAQHIDIDAEIDAASSLLQKANVDASEDVVVDVSVDVESGSDFLYDEAPIVIPTGFRDFDKVNHGALRGQQWLIGGYTGTGKTALVMNMIDNMAMAGFKVVLYSLEMTKTQVDQRDMARVTKTPLNTLINPRLISAAEKERLKDLMVKHNTKIRKKGGSKIYYFPHRDIKSTSILAHDNMTGSDVLVLDYISLLADSSANKQEAQWQRLNEIVRQFKRHATRHNKVVIILVQVTEEGALAYAKAMKTHCDVMMNIHRDKDDKSVMIIDIPKGRQQTDEPFGLKFSGAFSLVEDLPLGTTLKKKEPTKTSKTKAIRPNLSGVDS